MTDYEVLKAYGHSAAMAATIVIDAVRGDAHSIRWIETARTSVEGRGDAAAYRTRLMNAELPEANREVLAAKGMI